MDIQKYHTWLDRLHELARICTGESKWSQDDSPQREGVYLFKRWGFSVQEICIHQDTEGKHFFITVRRGGEINSYPLPLNGQGWPRRKALRRMYAELAA